MSIPIKTEAEIALMRKVGLLVASIIEETRKFIQPGRTTREVDSFVANLVAQAGGKSAFLHYRQGKRFFPGHICISLNDEVVHGIGSDRKIKYGDIVKLDVGVELNGFIGDSATTVAVGDIPVKAQQLLRVSEEALHAAIRKAVPGNRVGDIGHEIQRIVEGAGFTVVREFVGHGVGRKLHEEPQIPNFGMPGTGEKLKPGMTLAIEPMVNIGRPDVYLLDDGWTVVTSDHEWSAHFEHTVLITKNEPEILTCQRTTQYASKGTS